MSHKLQCLEPQYTPLKQKNHGSHLCMSLVIVIITTEDFLPTKTQRCLHIVIFALQGSGDAVKIEVTLNSVS